MYCIVCDKRLNIDEFDPFNDSHDTVMSTDSVVGKLEANFGSKHDGDIFIMAICDSCIDKKLASHTLLYKGNYMFDSFHTQDSILESKKGYKRRTNLDKLIND